MTTYDTLKASTSATAVFWVEVSGLPWAFSDGVVTAAKFGDAYTPTQTFIKSLEAAPDSFSRSIDIIPGRGSMGGFSVALTDTTPSGYPDGFFTWLFGGDRSTISQDSLAEDIEANETAWTLANGTMPVSGDGVNPRLAYCELETVWYLNHYSTGFPDPTTWDTVTRSAYHSPAVPHRSNIAGIYPIVTDHPTVWAGRIVTLFQTYMDADGSLASTGGTSATARAAAKKWRGILRDVRYGDNAWTIRCDSLDSLLQRQMVRGQARVPVQRRCYVADAMIDQDVPANGIIATVVQFDNATNTEYVFRCQIATGFYSRDGLIAAFNANWNAGTTADTDGNLTWKGTLAIGFADEDVTLQYTESGTAGEERVTAVRLNIDIYNVAANRAGSTGEYWDGIGVTPGPGWNGNVGLYFLPADDVTPTASATYSVSWPGSAATQLTISADMSHFMVAVGENEMGESITSFAAGNAVAIVSQAGVSACEVVRVDGASNILHVRFLTAVQQLREIVHTGTLAQPIEVAKAFYGYGGQVEGLAAAALGHSTLQALLSSGLGGFNHDDYDTLNEGVGIAIPHMSPMAGVDATESVIDVAGFEQFFAEAEAYQFTIVDFIHEPTTAMEWLTQRVGFLGGNLLVRNGQLSVRRIEALQSSRDADLTEDELQVPGRITTGQIHTLTGVTYEHNWAVGEQRFSVITEAVRGSRTASESESRVKYSDKGIRVPEPIELRWLGMDLLYQFGKENWVYDLVSDRKHWDIEPGDVIRFTDDGEYDTVDDTRRYQGMPNPDGTRGYATLGNGATRMLVLSVTTESSSGTTQIKAVNVRTRHSGYSPSAWIESWANAGGRTTLTCTAQFFSPTADGVDVSRFAVGDKVRVVSVNPTQAGAEPGVETSETGLTIYEINEAANQITLTGVLAVAWPSPPAAASQCMVLIHDPYQTANQTAAAKEWAHVGDSDGDIGDGGDKCYQW